MLPLPRMMLAVASRQMRNPMLKQGLSTSSSKFPSSINNLGGSRGGKNGNSGGQTKSRRRRRRTGLGTNVGGGEEETGNNNSNYYTVPAPVNCVGDERFKREVQTLFAKLIAAIEPMQNYNPDLTIILTNQDNHTLLIDLGPLHGTYTIARHDESRLLMVSSPISGINKYVCVVEGLEGVSGGSWKGEKDGHDFEGILVRDLIRQVNGFPNL